MSHILQLDLGEQGTTHVDHSHSILKVFPAEEFLTCDSLTEVIPNSYSVKIVFRYWI